MSTAVVSGRVDDLVRQKADAVLRKANLTPSDVIQNVWGTIAQTGEVPIAAQSRPSDDCGNNAFANFEKFLVSLPPVNPAYADWEDEDILELRVRDYA